MQNSAPFFGVRWAGGTTLNFLGWVGWFENHLKLSSCQGPPLLLGAAGTTSNFWAGVVEDHLEKTWGVSGVVIYNPAPGST